MMVDGHSDSFNEHAESLREKREQTDFDNLQHTLSGLETGQQTRHGLRKDEIDPVTGKKRNRIAEAIQRTLDWLLANDPNYRIAHEGLIGAVRNSQHKTQSALTQVRHELATARGAMDEILSRTAKLPNGDHVFKDKHGNVRDENGEIIPPILAAAIEWRGHEPTYEQYQNQRNLIDQLEAAEHELLGIDDELGEIHERNTRNDDPRSIEDMQHDTERAKELGKRATEIEASVKNRHEQNLTTDHSENQTSMSVEEIGQITLPKFGDKP